MLNSYLEPNSNGGGKVEVEPQIMRMARSPVKTIINYGSPNEFMAFQTRAILFIEKDATISIFLRLLDGIEPEILKRIEHAPKHVPGVLAVKDTRARWLGHKVHCDMTIEVDPDVSLKKADEISEKVEAALLAHVRQLGKAVVHVHSKSR